MVNRMRAPGGLVSRAALILFTILCILSKCGCCCRCSCRCLKLTHYRLPYYVVIPQASAHRPARTRLSLVEEKHLLDRLRQGDRDAFDSIFRSYYPSLVGMAEGVLRQRAVAEEVVQDVMLELWRRRESLKVEDSLKAYLFRSARNRALNHLRHARVEQRGEPHVTSVTEAPATAHARLVEEEIDAALRAALDDLPPGPREVFDLSRVHGLKYSEIAATLGISVKTVEARMGKALKALRERLAPWLPE